MLRLESKASFPLVAGQRPISNERKENKTSNVQVINEVGYSIVCFVFTAILLQ